MRRWRRRGNRPVRAVQRISAANLGEADARLLDVPAGSAGLNIERISYLATGKVIEFTRSIYRGDAYDFVAELRLDRPGRAKDAAPMTETHMRREIAEIPEAAARLLDQSGGGARRGRRRAARRSTRASSRRSRAARRTMPPPS